MCSDSASVVESNELAELNLERCDLGIMKSTQWKASSTLKGTYLNGTERIEDGEGL